MAVIGAETANDLGERDPRMFPPSRVKRGIRASIRVRADSWVWRVRCVYRAVVRIEW